jgi:16S rRNA (cytosine1402-N4)-methyltransferase
VVAHRPVLLAEVVAALNVRSDGVYVDCTFGRGGHSRAILERLGRAGRVIAIDRDLDAVRAAEQIGDARLLARHARFGQVAQVVEDCGVDAVDGMLLDLGVSSPQLDSAERGFSFRLEGPLDMRMDVSRGITAAQWLESASERELREVIKTYGEERFAGQVASAIVAARSREPIRTTRQLAQIVGAAVRTRELGQDPATRTFQALRIFLNQELEELSLALASALHLLKAGGRLAVISFHSLEDRIVKRFMRDNAQPSPVPRGLALPESRRQPPKLRLIGKPVRPSAAEIAANPRSRSALLRVAERLMPSPVAEARA